MRIRRDLNRKGFHQKKISVKELKKYEKLKKRDWKTET
jgi:hypothetical protein